MLGTRALPLGSPGLLLSGEGHHGLKAPKEDKPDAMARHCHLSTGEDGIVARLRLLNGQQFGVTETCCSHRRDEAKKFALSSFPSSSSTEAEPSALPKKRSSASDVPSEPRGAPPRPAPESQRGFFGRLRQ